MITVVVKINALSVHEIYCQLRAAQRKQPSKGLFKQLW